MTTIFFKKLPLSRAVVTSLIEKHYYHYFKCLHICTFDHAVNCYELQNKPCLLVCAKLHNPSNTSLTDLLCAGHVRNTTRDKNPRVKRERSDTCEACQQSERAG